MAVTVFVKGVGAVYIREADRVQAGSFPATYSTGESGQELELVAGDADNERVVAIFARDHVVGYAIHEPDSEPGIRP